MLSKIIYWFRFVAETLIYIIYPPVCPKCGEIADEYGALCEDCASKIFHINTEKDLPENISGVMRITKYHDGTRELLLRLKFENDLSVLPAIHKILAEVSVRDEIKNFLASADLAVYVPIHQERLKERGYNQVELIFRDWLKAQNLPNGNFLVRVKSTPRLFKFGFAERREILQDAFKLAEGANVRGKNILIVDDIYTTGATVSECARVLLGAGAAKIFVMALASDFGE
ncbi:MAG: ComF family protein [Selenomonadaceae bacterium]|nr:ComF family protein [Selenomonadaceae bacterium]